MKNIKHEIVTPTEMLPAWLFYHENRSSFTTFIAPHWHRSIELSYTISGSIDEFFIDGQKYKTEDGTILVVNTMDVHSIKVYPDHGHAKLAFTITFPYSFILSHFPDFDQYQFVINNQNSFSGVQRHKYRQLQLELDTLIEVYKSNEEWKWLELNVQLLKILKLLFEYFVEKRYLASISSRESQYKDRLLMIKEFIEENYQADIGLDDIAQLTYLSKEYIARFFKEHMGMTIGSYINAVRAKKARALIEENQFSFTDVSIRCGFSGLRTMDRALIKNYGQSAREIKNTSKSRI